MFAVIPHPTEALILSRTQKAMLSHLNAEAGKPYWIPLFPLWAFFNNFDYSAAESDTTMQTGGNVNTAFDAMQLKTIRDAIASFTIGIPSISNGEFFFPAILRFRNGDAAGGKIFAGKKTDCNAESPRAAENGYNSFVGFPCSCSVFRIADAEIGENKAVNDESETENIAGKRTENISAHPGDTDGAELRTWCIHASLWVKTERIRS